MLPAAAQQLQNSEHRSTKADKMAKAWLGGVVHYPGSDNPNECSTDLTVDANAARLVEWQATETLGFHARFVVERHGTPQ
jgi:hypothetical protein